MHTRMNYQIRPCWVLSIDFFARLLFVLALLALPSAARAQQLWFGSGDDLNVNGVVGHPDFMQLLDRNASLWPTGAAHVSVMLSRPAWLLRMPNSEVQSFLSFLKQHNMGLAISTGLVTSATCGRNVEGIVPLPQAVYPSGMKKLGVDLDYVIMDEPLYFAHDFTGRNSCGFSIAQVAASVADNVKRICAYYPKVQFVLVEPVGALPGGARELGEFLDDYKANLNEYPASVHFDIQWGWVDRLHRDWHAVVPAVIQMLKARRIGYGIIFDAGRTNGQLPTTDAAWVASAKANVRAFEAAIPDRPAQVLLESWHPNPVRITPESDPTTMTGYLKWYVTTHPH